MSASRRCTLAVLAVLLYPGACFDGPGMGRIARPILAETWMQSRTALEQLAIPNRNIKVWLPPAYDFQVSTRYPVLYVHDGQNVVDDAESWTGHSWRLASTLSRLISAGQCREVILVCVDNVTDRRRFEYSDSPVGDAYLGFLCDDIKPWIDKEFRTLPSAKDTSVMGSSLGGLAAFCSMWKRPDVVGHCACLSPVFQMPLLLDVALNGGRRRSSFSRIYIDNGGDTDEQRVELWDWKDGSNPGYWWLDSQLQPGVDAMRQALGLHETPFKYHREPGGRHNERGWSLRMERPLLHLFGLDPGVTL
ncbi:Alpha/Beta hydrolase protein [Pavlovales sp. CCMP2436]|nr:Alpha/Beta hydrolase protein [Pavlovales sp. CCMP2436]